MDINKINKLIGQNKIKKDKLKIEDDYKKREKLKLEIQINEIKIKLERLK